MVSVNNSVLQSTSQRQCEWSAVANDRKRRLAHWRLAALVLTIAGAVLATLAFQIDEVRVAMPVEGLDPPVEGAQNPNRVWSPLGIAATVCLVLSTWIGKQFLDGRLQRDWLRSRSISEALKKEAHLFAAQVAPYDQEDAERTLSDRRAELEANANDLAPLRATVEPDPLPLPENMADADHYDTHRVSRQIEDFYVRNVRSVESAISNENEGWMAKLAE